MLDIKTIALARNGWSGAGVELDTTLSKAGKAADAAAVGNALNSLSEEIVITAESIDALRNDKLDTADLTNAVNTALAQAKASGEFDGADGHTPQRGVDYWTAADQQAIVDQVLAALPSGDEVSY